jgi:hypothetical protein
VAERRSKDGAVADKDEIEKQRRCWSHGECTEEDHRKSCLFLDELGEEEALFIFSSLYLSKAMLI